MGFILSRIFRLNLVPAFHEGLRAGICRCGGIRTIGVAEVKWCKELTAAADHYYGIGLKYYLPAV
jgi:hypothetical protein